MKLTFLSFVLLSISLNAEEWTPLLTKDLADWTVWTGVPHTDSKVSWDAKADRPEDGKPIGEKDPLDIYTVDEIGGELNLFISGEVYAGLTSKKEYSNYHLSVEVLWGKKKYPPRLHQPRDSGILYHCVGPHGTFWQVWKQSLECQVQENDNGDYFQIGKVYCDVPVVGEPDSQRPKFSLDGEWREIGKGSYSAQRGENHEIKGGWNKVEVLTVGDRAIHLSNGKLVMALKNAKAFIDGGLIKLEKGQIQIQSEGAEVRYRRMKMKPIKDFPEEFQHVFDIPVKGEKKAAE